MCNLPCLFFERNMICLDPLPLEKVRMGEEKLKLSRLLRDKVNHNR